MVIRIGTGVVIGWSGQNHELIPDGSVLIGGDTITYVGTDRSSPADSVIDARGKVVCPGFVNLHVHSQLNWANRDWAGRRTEEIIPPAFPTRAG